MSLALDRESILEQAPQPEQSVTARPVRICFLIDNLNVAGTENHLLSLISRLDRTKVVPYLCLLGGHTQTSRDLEPSDCEVIRLGIRSLLSFHGLSAARKFVHWLKANEMDIVQTFFPDSTYFGIPLARLAGVPVRIRSRRNTGYWMTSTHRLLGRIISRLTTATVANSEACKQSVIAEERALPESVFVIQNGVDLSRFRKRDRTEKMEGETYLIGAVANLRPVKNLHLLIQAAAALVKKYDNVIFQIVGEGPSRDELQAEIDRLGLQKKFQLLGAVSNVTDFLGSLDVAILSSLSEGISNSIIEYKAAGLPIVATDVGGNGRLISDQHNGLLIPTDDAQSLIGAIDRLLTDSRFAASLGESARKSAELDHSSLAETAAYEQLYCQLVRPERAGSVSGTGTPDQNCYCSGSVDC